MYSVQGVEPYACNQLIKHEAGKIEVLYRYGGIGDLCRTIDIDAILQPAT